MAISKNLPTDYLLTEDLSPEDLERLSTQTEVAIDTETLGLNPWRDRLCLVQICDPQGHINLIRNDHWEQASNLKLFLASQVPKVFHYALFDCGMLFANTKTEVKNPYCTKISSRIARTYGSSHSLKNIIQELLQIEISKDEQTSDWSGDLTDEQLRYAVRDVLYLLEVKKSLEEKLKRRGVLQTGITFSELNQRCQAFIPTLLHLKLNGWGTDSENSSNVLA